ncbi:MAG: hypothetical protein OHK006_09180 [Thermodesulfovibrionales bacterium]
MPESIYGKGLITIFGCGLVFGAVALPLALRKVPRNIVYGFRTRTTLSDDFIWYEANAHFGRGMLAAALVMWCAGLVLYLLAPSPELFLPASVFVLVAPSLAAALSTARFIRSALREPGTRR